MIVSSPGVTGGPSIPTTVEADRRPIAGVAVRRAWRAQNGSSPGKSHIYGAAMTTAIKPMHWIWGITVVGAAAVVVSTASARFGLTRGERR